MDDATTDTNDHVRPDNLLSEEELRTMSRNVKSLLSKGVIDKEARKLPFQFSQVLDVATISTISTTHRVAAWNVLCAHIDQCIASQDTSAAHLIWDEGIWAAAFDLYIEQAHNARPKSSRQLLVTLTKALHKGLNATSCALVVSQSATQRQVRTLLEGDNVDQVKACAVSLGYFLQKDVVQLRDVLCHLDVPAGQYASEVQYFLFVLFRWMGRGDFTSAIGQLVAVLLDRATGNDSCGRPSDGTLSLPVWVEPLRKAVQFGVIEISHLRAHVFPVLFSRSVPDYVAFLQGLNFAEMLSGVQPTDDTEQQPVNGPLFASLQAGKDLGLVVEVDTPELLYGEDAIYVPITQIRQLLARISAPARLTGLVMLVVSKVATRPIPRQTFVILQRNLIHILADTDASFRGEVFGLIQRLVDRLRAATALLVRLATKDTSQDLGRGHPSASEMLAYHRNFIIWLVRFLTWELRPTASYQRHVSALQCLSILARSGVDHRVDAACYSKSALGHASWPFHIDVLSDSLQRYLLDLLVDPFDDVRQMAASVLQLPLTRGTGYWAETSSMNGVLAKAETTMLASGRADHADGVAYMYTVLHRHHGSDSDRAASLLLDKLEQMLRTAKNSLTDAVQKYPLHGLLTSLRYVLEALSSRTTSNNSTTLRVARCLHEVWVVVKPILCDDAPEGHLPEGWEEATRMSTKDTLSYCWRALKEASLLLGTVLISLQAEEVAEAIRQDLCDLCFDQLAELRHRGAFSTVAQTWVTCCIQTSSTPHNSSQLRQWYDRIILILRNKTTINTRRSAGLPSLVCGILVADSRVFLKQALRDLEAIAREPVVPSLAQEGSLPQVHAMNCMKDIFKNTKLGEQSEQHVTAALRLAADALRSRSWAVRNCGLMLFRGVIDRLLGTNDAYLETRSRAQKLISAEQHPGLIDIVLDLLLVSHPSTAEVSYGNEGVFPALQLMQRLHLPSRLRAQAQQSVLSLIGSSAWHIRDKAARTYASLVNGQDRLSEVHRLLQLSIGCQNTLHGALLTVGYVVNRVADDCAAAKAKGDDSEISSMVQSGNDMLHAVLEAAHLYHENDCPFTKAGYVDVLAACLDLIYVIQPSLGVENSFVEPRRHLHLLKVERFSFARELQGLLTESSKAGWTHAAPRAALARALCHEFVLPGDRHSDCETPRSLAVKLAHVDADACVTFFKAVRTRCKEKFKNGVLNDICKDLLTDSSVPPSISCEVIRTVLWMLSNPLGQSPEIYAEDTLAALLKSTTLVHPANPELANLSLEIRALCVEHIFCSQVLDSAANEHLEAWVTDCETAIDETGLYSRASASLAISCLSTLWTNLAQKVALSYVFFRLCLLVYDLLNDDDEDIRIRTSGTACRILRANLLLRSREDLMPLVASQRLIAYMTKTWSNAPELLTESFRRAFGLSEGDIASESVEQRLAIYLRPDTALFAEEKQNLYIDETREVRMWTRVLLRLPRKSITKAASAGLSRFVVSGLDVLVAKIKTEHDGPLGWTSSAEVFVLGLQVFYGMEVLLHWVGLGIRIAVQPSSLRRTLVEFAARFAASHGNCLWLAEIDRILAGSVRQRLKSVGRIVQELAAEAGVLEIA